MTNATENKTATEILTDANCFEMNAYLGWVDLIRTEAEEALPSYTKKYTTRDAIGNLDPGYWAGQLERFAERVREYAKDLRDQRARFIEEQLQEAAKEEAED